VPVSWWRAGGTALVLAGAVALAGTTDLDRTGPPASPGSLAEAVSLEGQTYAVGGKDFDEQLVLCHLAVAALESVGADVTERCRDEGVVKTPLDLTYTAETPLVSDRPAPRGRDRDAAGGPAPRGATPRRDARRRLRVTVTPRRVRTGRRTAFRVRVRPAVAGAIVRIGNRRARTGPRGRARIVMTLRRPGRRTVRVTKPGFAGARAAVVVRR